MRNQSNLPGTVHSNPIQYPQRQTRQHFRLLLKTQYFKKRSEILSHGFLFALFFLLDANLQCRLIKWCLLCYSIHVCDQRSMTNTTCLLWHCLLNSLLKTANKIREYTGKWIILSLCFDFVLHILLPWNLNTSSNHSDVLANLANPWCFENFGFSIGQILQAINGAQMSLLTSARVIQAISYCNTQETYWKNRKWKRKIKGPLPGLPCVTCLRYIN